MDRAFLILHGLDGSGPDHWQTWLADELRAARETVSYPDLPDAGAPDPDAWRAALARELTALLAPVTVVCHSLACALWLHHAATGPGEGQRAERVVLVAPPGPDAGVPQIAPFFPVPINPGAVRAAAPMGTRLVCSDDDPYCPGGAQAIYGEPLGLATDLFSGGRHLNPDAGYGPWPAMLAYVRGEAAGL